LHHEQRFKFTPRIKHKTLEAYAILPRPQGLHPAGALARTPRKKQPKNKPRPWQQLGQSLTKSITNVQPLKEYTYSSTGSGATIG
jgi:hypothetical protein